MSSAEMLCYNVARKRADTGLSMFSVFGTERDETREDVCCRVRANRFSWIQNPLLTGFLSSRKGLGASLLAKRVSHNVSFALPGCLLVLGELSNSRPQPRNSQTRLDECDRRHASTTLAICYLLCYLLRPYLFHPVPSRPQNAPMRFAIYAHLPQDERLAFPAIPLPLSLHCEKT